ncbi:MAG: hypothetical protein K0Q87_151 [Neobacillus sp.]|jgi:hypothetical protein|nr:hypothetical protein [Neobacillus sp.]
MSNSPGIFYNTQFVTPYQAKKSGNPFSKFLGYQDREEAIKDQNRQISMFIDYQDNPLKSKGLMGMDGHYLSDNERSEYTARYDIAEKNGTVLWQDLFSFDNDWLEHHGLYNPDTKKYDERRLVEAIKSTMELVIQREKLQQPLFAMAFHRNTQHLHCHVSMVEENPSRPIIDVRYVDETTMRDYWVKEPSGFRKPSTVSRAESHFASQLLQFQKPLKEITDIIRQSIVASTKEKGVVFNPKYEQAVLDLYRCLPNQRRMWLYGYAKNQKFKQPLDRLIRLYLSTNHMDDCKRLNELLTWLDKEYKNTYRKAPGRPETEEKNGIVFTNADKNKAYTKPPESYKENKIDDLFRRLGNALLTELRDFDREMRKKGIKDPKELLKVRNSDNQSMSRAEKDEQHDHVFQEDPNPEEKKNTTQGNQNDETRHEQNGDTSRKDKNPNSSGSEKEKGKQNHNTGSEKQKESSYRQQFDSISNGNEEKARFIRSSTFNPDLYRKKYETNRLIRKIDRAMMNDFKKWKNELEYERMQQEIDYKIKYEQ